MAHRLARAGATLTCMTVLTLPTAAFADGGHDHGSPSADPDAGHAGHAEADAHDQHDEGSAGSAHDHDVTPDEGHADHEDHQPTPAPAPETESHDHGTTTSDEDAGHTDHGSEPDSISPQVRNLVLSGFAGVNAAVIFGAWMVRRTGPDPDPRKRNPKASR